MSQPQEQELGRASLPLICWSQDNALMHESRRASPAPSLAVTLRRMGPVPPLGNTVELALLAKSGMSQSLPLAQLLAGCRNWVSRPPAL